MEGIQSLLRGEKKKKKVLVTLKIQLSLNCSTKLSLKAVNFGIQG
jgi:hypothetical protein